MDSHSGKRDLGKSFQQLFELAPAFDAASLDQVFRIRHDVYCRELGWEPVREDGRETDEFDRHSFHCLLRRRDTGEPVGCTRLILARPEDPGDPLPFERSCSRAIDRRLADPARMPRNTLGEVSRLAVLSSFRQRQGEASSAVSITDADFAQRSRHARFPFIPVSLYLGATAMALRFGVEHVFVLTEPRLASHFARIGFDIRTVGATIDHHGVRVPSLLSSTKTVQGLRAMIRPLYAVIEESVNEAFLAHPEFTRSSR